MAIRNAFTCSQNDVNNAVNGIGTMSGGTSYSTPAADGDTVIVPGLTSAWPTYVIVSHAITIQGAGVGNTIFQLTASNDQLFALLPPAGKVIRLTGFEFQMGARTTSSSGMIVTDGGSGTGPSDAGSVRIDNCKFNLISGFTLKLSNTFGVCDHCAVLPAGGTIPFYVFNTHYAGEEIGNGSYADQSYLGTNRFFFFEDCTFIYPIGGNYAAIDGWYGTRYVVRHCTFAREFLSVHGTESSQGRGSRVIEVYNNTFNYDPAHFGFLDIRSGTGVVYNNTTTGNDSPTISLTDDRIIASFPPFGGADGTNPADVNDQTDYTGNGFGGGPNGLFASGTVSSAGLAPTTVASGSNGALITSSIINVASNAGFPTLGYIAVLASDGYHSLNYTGLGTNSFTGCSGGGSSTATLATGNSVYPTGNDVMKVNSAGWPTTLGNSSVIKTSGANITTQPFAVIRSNTSDTLTFSGGFGAGGDLVFATGDGFAIHKVIQSIDQPGRVRGSLLVGGTPSLPSGWNDQVTEPIYAWNNKRTEDNTDILMGGASAGPVTNGVDYINNTVIPAGYSTVGTHGATDALHKIGADSDGGSVYALDAYGYAYPHPLTITSGAPTFTSANNVTFTTGAGGTFQATASGTIPITFSLVSGSWPAGTNMNSTGLITIGSSTSGGVYSVTLGAINGIAPNATQNFILTVSSGLTPPVNVTLPTVTGSTIQGQTLTGTLGTWSGNPTPTYARQWRRCDASGSTCSNIAGATSATYLLVVGDVGSTIRERIVSTNSQGSATADSAATAVVTGGSGGGGGTGGNTRNKKRKIIIRRRI